ncbi:MAG: CRISPR system precrRNA processing endoribonuclease RAMP protein Cas6, partial [Thermodesulfobacteriota bacterium]|nr:CRISPR system precrRNA processing endoribonuclease RAMP protein Cas6 [Thermodesulfobacteriota bacterium]
FEGDFEPFMPFLLLGEFIHVGKGTSFGLGKYEIMRG